jgi:hypothetical protein
MLRHDSNSNSIFLLLQQIFYVFLFLFSLAHQPNTGLGRLVVEPSRPHTIRHAAGIYVSSERVINSSQTPLPTQHITNTKDKYSSIRSAGFETSISLIKLPRIYADRMATGISILGLTVRCM